jgi:hypothetical protein
MTRTRNAWAFAAAAALLAAGCSNALDAESTKAVLTQHQRDSVLSKSALPGAVVVDRALEVSSTAAHRAAGFGATVDSLSR